jgi:PAS domain S-box-containing protein
MYLHRKWAIFLIPIATTALAFLIRLYFLENTLGSESPFLLFYLPVIVSAWYGGIWPGLLATLLSVLAIDYWYFPVLYTFHPLFPLHLNDKFKIVLFVLEGTIISLTCEILLRREQEFRAIYNLAAVGIAQVDMRGRFLRVNQKLCEILGYKEKELRGKSFLDITYPEDRERNSAEFQRILSNKIKGYSTEKRYIHKDGHFIWVDLYITILVDSIGKPLRTIGIVVDISGRKLAEEAVTEADHRKDEFLATLAHELRNPLSAINNSVQLLDITQDKNLHKKVVATMGQQIRQMIILINDLMDISRIARGKINLDKKNIMLADAIAAAIQTVQFLFEAKAQKLVVKIPNEPLYIYGDMVRLTQICVNLLTNASKFTDKEGTISIEVYKEGKEVSIVVRDNGIGIPHEMLTRVFEIFTQVNNSLERTTGGLGIGLYLTRSLVVLHGGSIEVYSEGLGKGSEFTVRLPTVNAIPEEQPQLMEENLPAPHHHYRVLIVDDNDASAKTTGWMMESFGHEYKIAHDGPSAIELTRSFQPDVILLDIGLPGMNGYDTCRLMRKEPTFRKTIIIAQTGWGGIEHHKLSKEAGFDYHMVKPIDMNVLNQLFEEM